MTLFDNHARADPGFFLEVGGGGGRAHPLHPPPRSAPAMRIQKTLTDTLRGETRSLSLCARVLFMC